MAIQKKISLTINGYEIKLSNQITLYQNDQLHLIFEINEYGVEVVNGRSVKKIMPINPLSAILFFETPNAVDSVEAAAIKDNTVTFHLKNVHTQHIGVSKMQIQLMDAKCCQITLPDFTFEVRKNIYDGELHIVDVVIYDEATDSVVVDEDDNIIISGRTVVTE